LPIENRFMHVFTEREAENFLEQRGFPTARRKYASTADEAVSAARIVGFPVVMKIASKNIIHKSDVHGVKLNLMSESDVIHSFNELSRIHGFEGVLVQEFIEGTSMIVGLKEDSTFGHAIAFGLGGIYTEILKDIAFRVCPITLEDADSMLNDLKSKKILEGARGLKPANMDYLKSLLVAVSKLPLHFKNIKELDINPLVVNDKKSYIVDARIVFS